MPTINLPWGAWYQDTLHALELPDYWSVDVVKPHDAPMCSTEDVSKALESPIGSPTLRELARGCALESPIGSPTPRELARGCNSACLVVDDLARPTRASDVLLPLLKQLADAGLPQDAVSIVVATGSHGELDEQQLAWKIGDETASRYRVECHDCHGDLAATGINYGDHELRVNRTFWEADLKIAVGSVLPHSFAGYSGGAKLVLPGLCDVTATARSHKFVQLGLRGGTDPNENRFRLEAEDLVRQLGLDFVVCVLSNVNRETVGVFAGDVVAAHRSACTAAGHLFATEAATEYDCAFLNAYPKDVDLIQSENVFVALKTAKAPVVHDGGVIVVMTAASEGLGRHGLFEPGGASYRKPRKKRALGNREIWVYAPSVSTEDVQQLYWEGYPVFHGGQELTRALADRFPGSTKAVVFPCAPMQQVTVVHDRHQEVV